MKKFDVSSIAFAGQDTNVSLEDLAKSGSTVVSFGIRNGETIVFLSQEDYQDPKYLCARPIGDNGSKELLVAVYRGADGTTPGWYSISDIRRVDHALQPIDAHVRTDMRQYVDDKARLLALAGKTIKAGDAIKFQVVDHFEADPETKKLAPAKNENGEVILKVRGSYEITWA